MQQMQPVDLPKACMTDSSISPCRASGFDLLATLLCWDVVTAGDTMSVSYLRYLRTTLSISHLSSLKTTLSVSPEN